MAARFARAKRWMRTPPARIVIFLLLFMVLTAACSALLEALGLIGKAAPATQKQFGNFLVMTLPAIGAYALLARFIERRSLADFAGARAVPHVAGGFVGGAALITAVVAVLWAAGSYSVTGTNPEPRWVSQLLVGGFGAAIIEEILTRGVLFRICEEGIGTWGALVVSALFFGLGHVGNQGATWWSCLAVAIEAGLMLGLLYHVFRSLPLCIGVHAGWNFTQGTVWGVPVSGGSDTGWLTSTRAGPEWLSGGIFGAEASVVAVVLCSAVTAALLRTALKRRSIVPPWFRRAPAADALPAADNRVVTA